MSLRNFSTVGGLLLLVGLVAACVSTEETNAGPQFKYPSEASFCEALAKAECNAKVVEACYSANDDTNKASCISARQDFAQCRASVTGVENPPVTHYNPAAAESCISKHASIYGDAKVDRLELKAANDACIKVFAGSGTAGSGCSVDVDCDTTKNLLCVMKAGTTEGTCAVPTEVALGDDCSDAAAQCEDDQFCGAAASGDICQKKVPEGKTCSAEVPCTDDSKCDAIDMMTGEGTCAAKIADTQPCVTDSECAGSFCDKDPNAAAGDMGICAHAFILSFKSGNCDGFKP